DYDVVGVKIQQTDGKIVLAGQVGQSNVQYAAVVRLTTTGSLDPSFGSGGKALPTLGADSTRARGRALPGDGKAGVVGEARDAAGGLLDMAVARFTTNGSADATFGSGGLATIDLGDPYNPEEAGRAVAFQPDGKLLVAGNLGDGSQAEFLLVRLNPDGSLDPT